MSLSCEDLSPCEKRYQEFSASHVVDAVAGAFIDFHLRDSIAQRLDLSEVPMSNPIDSSEDGNTPRQVAER